MFVNLTEILKNYLVSKQSDVDYITSYTFQPQLLLQLHQSRQITADESIVQT